jgi:hypothetical protein
VLWLADTRVLLVLSVAGSTVHQPFCVVGPAPGSAVPRHAGGRDMCGNCGREWEMWVGIRVRRPTTNFPFKKTAVPQCSHARDECRPRPLLRRLRLSCQVCLPRPSMRAHPAYQMRASSPPASRRERAAACPHGPPARRQFSPTPPFPADVTSELLSIVLEQPFAARLAGRANGCTKRVNPFLGIVTVRAVRAHARPLLLQRRRLPTGRGGWAMTA